MKAKDGRHYCGKHSDGQAGSILTCEYIPPDRYGWRWQCPDCRIKDLQDKLDSIPLDTNRLVNRKQQNLRNKKANFIERLREVL